ncbi:Pol polyprotein [Plakobranchus ocellatus]|uniref:Pol polyprotein n=1 Tax=Plakobranchus ocellatus TaxID=259542 RepID=A0AAV4ATX8_9GAST|nr:Pol polyprotein [Plakobranchus ocellatus]
MHAWQRAAFTLDEKYAFSKRSLKLLGHIIDKSGIHADPSKIKAIIGFIQPQNVTELQRFLGIVNQMTKFSSKLTDAKEQPRYLKKDPAWLWGPSQVAAFTKVKELLSSTPILVHHSPARETITAANPSNQFCVLSYYRYKKMGPSELHISHTKRSRKEVFRHRKRSLSSHEGMRKLQ